MSALGFKIAVAGKGGVGKTTVVGSIARIWARDGVKVLAVDADPASHLHSILEVPADRVPKPISAELDLIEERTGARPGAETGPFYKLNPRVDDIPEGYSAVGADGVRLMVLGTIRSAGTGCFCPENAVLRGLIDHVILERDEAVLVDMEAGLEQFGRSTCRGVDLLLIVVEPGARAVDTGQRIAALAKEMGVRRFAILANGVRNSEEEDLIRSMLSRHTLSLFSSLPYSEAVARADMLGKSVFEIDGNEDWMRSVKRLSEDIRSLLE
ncbi:MAG: AAA family ATPase [Methanobacteriota archaeon]|nr:MAG: AAA family ATPase [Euryarchaeota archaeon]